MNRRRLLQLGLGTAAVSALPRLLVQNSKAATAAPALKGALITKPIPSSGERIPVVGIGTARRYDNTTPEARTEIKEVLRLYPTLGGKLIDTAASYGEPLVGELVSELGNREKLFLATKVGVGGRGGPGGKDAGLAQIERSLQRLRTNKIDLIAVHNLGDTDTQLGTLRDLKSAGRIRYVGVTTSTDNQYEALEAVMKSQKLDVVQVDFAIDNRNAAERILPLAQDRGMAVMANLPFGRERLWNAVQGKPLPEWAAEFDCTTWAQFFLKYIASHPAVTCAIPGTARVKYVQDNMQASHGRLPDAAMRTRMEQLMAKH